MQIRAAEPIEATTIAHVHDTCWRAAYAEILPLVVLHSSLLADRERLWTGLLSVPHEQRCAFVAEDNGVIVGCAWSGPEESGDPHYRAELLGLYLLPVYQRRGLGRQLMSAIVANVQRQGFQSLLLWALAENAAARRFYEALGGQFLREQYTVLCDIPVPEVAYGWPDLGHFFRSAYS